MVKLLYYIYRIIEPWQESTITWANQPATTEKLAVFVPGHTNSSQNFVNIDVTEQVREILQNPNQNFGFMLQLSTEDPYRLALLASSDHVNANLHPKLTIQYGNP